MREPVGGKQRSLLMPVDDDLEYLWNYRLISPAELSLYRYIYTG